MFLMQIVGMSDKSAYYRPMLTKTDVAVVHISVRLILLLYSSYIYTEYRL